jgi:hypothetical protein
MDFPRWVIRNNIYKLLVPKVVIRQEHVCKTAVRNKSTFLCRDLENTMHEPPTMYDY